MISFPNAKINLGLHITEKRPDGYHNIETVFYPVKWCDILELLPSKTSFEKVKLTISGLPVEGSNSDNLLVKAFSVFAEQASIQPEEIRLHKNIPMGAGLGGGSADAAFLLKMLNEKYKKNFSSDQLKSMASVIGSDCPFFIDNKPVYATGKGDQFEAINISVKGLKILVVYPGFHSNTKLAYSRVIPNASRLPLNRIILDHPIEKWKEVLVNDFEDSVFEHYPETKSIKSELYKMGAIYASLSGSGSSVYGIFENLPETFQFNGPETRIYKGTLV